MKCSDGCTNDLARLWPSPDLCELQYIKVALYIACLWPSSDLCELHFIKVAILHSIVYLYCMIGSLSTFEPICFIASIM